MGAAGIDNSTLTIGTATGTEAATSARAWRLWRRSVKTRVMIWSGAHCPGLMRFSFATTCVPTSSSRTAIRLATLRTGSLLPLRSIFWTSSSHRADRARLTAAMSSLFGDFAAQWRAGCKKQRDRICAGCNSSFQADHRIREPSATAPGAAWSLLCRCTIEYRKRAQQDGGRLGRCGSS